MQNNISSFFRCLFEQNGSKTFLIDRESEQSFSYAEFSTIVGKGASYFSTKQVSHADSIVVISENRLELPFIYTALWSLGAKVTPINPDLSPSQIAEIIRSAEAELVIISDQIDCNYALSECQQVAKDVIITPSIDLVGLFSVWNEYGSSMTPFEQLEDEDVFLRVYTSGSTAAPKGIDLVFSRLINNEIDFSKELGFDSDSRFYNLLPMSYLGGIHNLFLIPLVNGGSFVLDKPLGPRNLFGFWDNVEKFQINTLWFSPTMLTMLMALRDDENVLDITSKVKKTLVGMAPLSVTTKQQFEHRFNLKLLENYALSETAFISSHNDNTTISEGCKGTILPRVEVKVYDSLGEIAKPGQEGEIVISSPYLFEGYVNAPQADHDAITDEGFKTGDLGYILENELYITGRVKDLIIRGGLNISPALVEAQICKISGVKLAAVVGVEHPMYGEEVAAALIVDKPEPEESFLDKLSEVLPHFQCPKNIIFLDEFPLGMTGKVDKKEIKKLFD